MQEKEIFQIYICDDTKKHAVDLQNSLQELKELFPSVVTLFFDAEKLLSRISDLKKNKEMLPDIIFLDICMPETDGITLGKKINDLCPGTFLVFVTAYAEYAMKGYEARAFRYLLKPLKNEDLQALFIDIRTEIAKTRKIMLKGRRSNTLVAIRDILYISAEDKYAIVYTGNGHFISDLSLTRYEERLGSYGFYRIHRKYLVNLFHHRGISGNKIQVSNGTFLPISRSRIAAYQNRVLEYMREDLLC